jgi:hypothetical protein
MIARTLDWVRALLIVASSIVVAASCSDHRSPTSPNAVSLGVGNSAPATPSGMTASATPPSRIDVGWTDNSNGEAGFEIHYATAPTAAFMLLAETPANVATAGFPDVGYSVTRCYKVRAFTAVGKKNRTWSGFSNTACATTPAPPPTAPRGTLAIPKGSTVVEVRWIDDASDEDGFRVERSPSNDCTAPWESVGTTGPNIASFTDAGRTPEQWLCYRVFAFKTAGSVSSAPSPTSATVPLAAPTSLAGSATDHRTIQLTWVDNSAFEYGYELQRAATAAGPYQRVASLSANAVSHTDQGLTASTTYWYRVQAYGAFSDFSGDVAITTQPLPPPAPPVAPEFVDATPFSSTDATVRWWKSWNATDYRVEHSLDASSWLPAEPQGYDPYGTPRFSGATEQRNCYRVVALNDQGETPSAMDCVTLIAGPGNAYVGPNGVFHWTDQSSFEEFYEIWYCGPEECAPLYSVPANTESFYDQWYYSGFDYWVIGLKDGGSSDAVGFWKGDLGVASTARKPMSLRDYLAHPKRPSVKKP